MPTPAQIVPGCTLVMHLEVRFHDGFVGFSTFDQEPITCRLGDGTLAPGMETALLGLAPGEDHLILAGGSELFAEYDPDNLHWLPLSDFPSDPDPAPGQVVAFTTPAGHETCGLVLEREGEGAAGRVRVDFNHPFAGRSLTLRVRILSVA